MFRTSLCPDRCSHETQFARFDVTEHLEYSKPGEYGDAKSETVRPCGCECGENAKVKAVSLLVQVGFGIKQVRMNNADIIAQLESLKPGDAVRMQWVHDYVTRNNCSSPERFPTSIQTL